MSVHRSPSGGRVPPSEALREGDSTAAGPRVSGDFIATDARGPLRWFVDRLGVFALCVALVLVGSVIGVLFFVFCLAVFVAWATLSIAWAMRFPIIGGCIAGLIAYGAGWV